MTKISLKYCNLNSTVIFKFSLYLFNENRKVSPEKRSSVFGGAGSTAK